MTAAVPFWRAAGMTYITYSNICANLVRNCLKEPHRAEALAREKVHFSVSKWAEGKPQKPSQSLLLFFPLSISFSFFFFCRGKCFFLIFDFVLIWYWKLEICFCFSKSMVNLRKKLFALSFWTNFEVLNNGYMYIRTHSHIYVCMYLFNMCRG